MNSPSDAYPCPRLSFVHEDGDDERNDGNRDDDPDRVPFDADGFSSPALDDDARH